MVRRRMTTITRELLIVDVPNRNGRVYSRDVVEKMIEDFNKRNEKQTMLGEITQLYASYEPHTVNLDRISHSVDELFIEDGNLKATITVMDTPMGDILKTLIEAVPVSVGMGLRGTGTVKDDCVGDYTLITIDTCRAPYYQPVEQVDRFQEIFNSMGKDGLL